MKSIIEDTRQKPNNHVKKHADFTDIFHTRIIRSKLVVGDYALPPKRSIDTKQDISEIAANMCGSSIERKRFTRECKIAKDIGCQLFVLIEDKRFHSIDDLYGRDVWILSKPKRKIQGDQLAVAMLMMSERYGVEFLFCDPDDSAEVIYNLLMEE